MGQGSRWNSFYSVGLSTYLVICHTNWIFLERNICIIYIYVSTSISWNVNSATNYDLQSILFG